MLWVQIRPNRTDWPAGRCVLLGFRVAYSCPRGVLQRREAQGPLLRSNRQSPPPNVDGQLMTS